MMNKLFFVVMLLFSSCLLYAQKKTITAAEAKKYVGKTVTVSDEMHEARLMNISKDEENVLYTGTTDYAHRTMAFIFPQAVLKRFSYNPNDRLITHHFSATGKVVMYEGKPAMYIMSEDQIALPAD